MTTTGPEGVGATVSSTRGYGDTTSVVGSFVTTLLTPMVGTGSFYEETSSLTTYVVSGSLTTVVDGTTVVVGTTVEAGATVVVAGWTTCFVTTTLFGAG